MAASKTSLSAGLLIREILTEAPGVAAITRNIFPVVADKATLPYVAYRRTAFEQRPQKSSRFGAETIRLEVQCFAADYAGAVELAEAVRLALDGMGAVSADGSLVMRSCTLTGSAETWADDAFIQVLIFNISI